MARDRVSFFDDDNKDDLDVSGFKPKTGPDPDAPSSETMRAIAEASNFPSRQAAKAPPPTAPVAPPAAPAEQVTAKRQPRRHRTGRTAPLSARTTPATVELLYAIADQQGWLVGETIEHALAALQRDLAGQGRG